MIQRDRGYHNATCATNGDLLTRATSSLLRVSSLLVISSGSLSLATVRNRILLLLLQLRVYRLALLLQLLRLILLLLILLTTEVAVSAATVPVTATIASSSSPVTLCTSVRRVWNEALSSGLESATVRISATGETGATTS